MKRAVGVLLAAIMILALANAPSELACGYHDAGSINRGMLNLVYPNALYVTSAVWKAQLVGLLSRDDRPRQRHGRFWGMELLSRTWANCDTVCQWSAIKEAMIPPSPSS